MLPQKLGQIERGQAYRFGVILAIGYPVMELAPHDVDVPRWRVTNITSGSQDDGIGQPLLKPRLNNSRILITGQRVAYFMRAPYTYFNQFGFYVLSFLVRHRFARAPFFFAAFSPL
jgi:hypothetical protein